MATTFKTMYTENELEAFACPVDPLCLGLYSWYGCPGNADMSTSRPHPEREPLLHPSGPSTSTAINASEPLPVGHFAFVSDQEIAKLSEGLVPQNTAKITIWALKNFQDWMTNRNQQAL